jgi:hypothetical protein
VDLGSDFGQDGARVSAVCPPLGRALLYRYFHGSSSPAQTEKIYHQVGVAENPISRSGRTAHDRGLEIREESADSFCKTDQSLQISVCGTQQSRG